MFNAIRNNFLLTVLLTVPVISQAAGFGINSTRLVYPADSNSINVTLRNTELTTAYLVPGRDKQSLLPCRTRAFQRDPAAGSSGAEQYA